MAGPGADGDWQITHSIKNALDSRRESTMSEPMQKSTSRRDFLKNTGRLAAISTLAAGIVPRMYAAENNTIKIVLIGCGGRGTGAADNALSVKNGPIKLVALADVF
jgi:hypothetical protein